MFLLLKKNNVVVGWLLIQMLNFGLGSAQSTRDLKSVDLFDLFFVLERKLWTRRKGPNCLRTNEKLLCCFITAQDAYNKTVSAKHLTLSLLNQVDVNSIFFSVMQTCFIS